MSISLRPSRRDTACAAMMAGTFLLTASVLATTYAADRLVKIPLTIQADTVHTGTAELLDVAALAEGTLFVDPAVPITVNQRVTAQEPSDADVVTLQSALQMTRDDRTGTAAIVNASVDRVTVDRRTGFAVEEPIGAIQGNPDDPADPVAHDAPSSSFPSTLRSSRTLTSTRPSARVTTSTSWEWTSSKDFRFTGFNKRSRRPKSAALSPFPPRVWGGRARSR